MIKQVRDELLAWAGPQAEDDEYELSLQMPGQTEGETTVHLYLLDISDDDRRHTAGRPSIQPSLRYLVTTSGSDIPGAHDLLSRLLFSALEDPRFEVEFEPASSPVWAALRTPARPAFVLRVPIEREAPPVRGYRVKAVSVGLQGFTSLYGQVLGRPGDVPVAQARIDLIGANKYAYTDETGCFTIPGVPAPDPDNPDPKKRKPLALVITARGCERIYTVTRTGTDDAPLIFCMGFPEPGH